MLVLVVGDAHIPYRTSEVPPELKRLLVPGKIDTVVCVGNVEDPDTLKLLQNVTPQKPIVRVPGTEDTIDADSRTSHVFSIGSVNIGVISSFEVIPQDDIDSLAAIARELDVSVLLWGSCQQQTEQWAGHYFISPGSLTGTETPANVALGEISSEPGFCLLNVEDNQLTVFMYKLADHTVKVEKAELSLPPNDEEDLDD